MFCNNDKLNLQFSIQAAIARLEALENDNAGFEVLDANDDDKASLDDEDQGMFCLNPLNCFSYKLRLNNLFFMLPV